MPSNVPLSSVAFVEFRAASACSPRRYRSVLIHFHVSLSAVKPDATQNCSSGASNEASRRVSKVERFRRFEAELRHGEWLTPLPPVVLCQLDC